MKGLTEEVTLLRDTLRDEVYPQWIIDDLNEIIEFSKKQRIALSTIRDRLNESSKSGGSIEKNEIDDMLTLLTDHKDFEVVDLPEMVMVEVFKLRSFSMKYASGEKNFPWSVVRDQLAVACDAIEAYKRTYVPKKREDQKLSTDYNILWEELNNGAQAFGFIVDDRGWIQNVICQGSRTNGFAIVNYTAFNTLDEAMVECEKYKLKFITFTP